MVAWIVGLEVRGLSHLAFTRPGVQIPKPPIQNQRRLTWMWVENRAPKLVNGKDKAAVFWRFKFDPYAKKAGTSYWCIPKKMPRACLKSSHKSSVAPLMEGPMLREGPMTHTSHTGLFDLLGWTIWNTSRTCYSWSIPELGPGSPFSPLAFVSSNGPS